VAFTTTKDEYLPTFNTLMRETDVLWTTPSELCFYAGLGIPIVMSPPLGAHEERNQTALMRAGAGYQQENPRAAVEWLSDWTQNGLLAIGAFNGYLHVPNCGTENIKRVLFRARPLKCRAERRATDSPRTTFRPSSKPRTFSISSVALRR
jgi:hypothetical protein